MDADRPKTSGRRPSERTLHQWDQDDPDPNRPSVEKPQTGRPQTRIERPVSRRGIQNDQNRESTPYRAGTPARSAMRPSSASTYSGRGSTANPRLNTTASVMGMSRISTGLPPTAHANSGMMERPVTQQGIAGLRPGTTRGLTRQIQDKRYYEGLVQLKIRELTQEIASISREIDTQNKERATFSHYDDRAKKLAAELTELQGKLADYNIIVDKVTSNIDKESMEEESHELRALNDKATEEIERLFQQRRLKEQQLHNMEDKIESEQKKEERIVENMSPEIRAKYDQLIALRNDLESEIGMMQKEIDSLSTDRLSLEEQIALSQVKQEAVKLRVKIAEVEEKKTRLQDEQKNKLTPEMEREKLLSKVKQDNMDIVAAEKRITEVKRQISQIEQELEHLETDQEENHSEKQVKYNELRKREEAIEQFMPTFDQNRSEEIDKIASLEESIVDKLRKLAFSIDNDAGFDELAMLDVLAEHNDDQSFEGLSKEHIRLQQVLKKMETLEEKLKAELIEITDKISAREEELVVLEDIDGLRARSEAEFEQLTVKKEELRRRQPNLEQELANVKREHGSIKKELEKNDIYVQISALEERHDRLKEGNDSLKKLIEEGRDRVNYLPLRDKALEMVTVYNDMLKDNTRTLY